MVEVFVVFFLVDMFCDTADERVPGYVHPPHEGNVPVGEVTEDAVASEPINIEIVGLGENVEDRR